MPGRHATLKCIFHLQLLEERCHPIQVRIDKIDNESLLHDSVLELEIVSMTHEAFQLGSWKNQDHIDVARVGFVRLGSEGDFDFLKRGRMDSCSQQAGSGETGDGHEPS